MKASKRAKRVLNITIVNTPRPRKHVRALEYILYFSLSVIMGYAIASLIYS